MLNWAKTLTLTFVFVNKNKTTRNTLKITLVVRCFSIVMETGINDILQFDKKYAVTEITKKENASFQSRVKRNNKMID